MPSVKSHPALGFWPHRGRALTLIPACPPDSSGRGGTADSMVDSPTE